MAFWKEQKGSLAGGIFYLICCSFFGDGDIELYVGHNGGEEGFPCAFQSRWRPKCGENVERASDEVWGQMEEEFVDSLEGKIDQELVRYLRLAIDGEALVVDYVRLAMVVFGEGIFGMLDLV
ncbi:unnamed protein product [Ilex paraguariensis]|uniref:Uncharacterized protein n=1 Tax=Ilex paraguariensis TaxID=185542 RepID=A0ABC8R7I5_9AQUA